MSHGLHPSVQEPLQRLTTGWSAFRIALYPLESVKICKALQKHCKSSQACYDVHNFLSLEHIRSIQNHRTRRKRWTHQASAYGCHAFLTMLCLRRLIATLLCEQKTVRFKSPAPFLRPAPRSYKRHQKLVPGSPSCWNLLWNLMNIYEDLVNIREAVRKIVPKSVRSYGALPDVWVPYPILTVHNRMDLWNESVTYCLDGLVFQWPKLHQQKRFDTKPLQKAIFQWEARQWLCKGQNSLGLSSNALLLKPFETFWRLWISPSGVRSCPEALTVSSSTELRAPRPCRSAPELLRQCPESLKKDEKIWKRP